MNDTIKPADRIAVEFDTVVGETNPNETVADVISSIDRPGSGVTITVTGEHNHGWPVLRFEGAAEAVFNLVSAPYDVLDMDELIDTYGAEIV